MSAPPAENETSISDAELHRLSAAVEAVAPVRAVPARITGGRRWQSLPHSTGGDLPISPPTRIPISTDAGLVMYGFHQLTAVQRERVFAALGPRCEEMRNDVEQ